MARTNYEMDEALEKLMKKGIKRIKISPDPVTPAIDERKVKLIELQRIEVEE